MTGFKGFIFGFCISLSGVAISGQLYHHPSQDKEIQSSETIKIDLFKKSNPSTKSLSNNIFAYVEKTSFNIDTKNDVTISSDGIEDDEILSININDEIPIDYTFTSANSTHAEITDEDDSNDDKVALLPNELDEENSTLSSPWIAAKSNISIKNKIVQESFNKESNPNLFNTETESSFVSQEQPSYKVAEKIKQSIIFPIPDEILNDENLTPTFIRTDSSKANSNPTKKTLSITPALKKTKNQANTHITETTSLQNNINNETNPNILDSITSWFSDKPNVASSQSTPSISEKKRSTPLYSSQENKSSSNEDSSTKDLARFYESLQTTKKQHIQREIVPTELKLSFQPGRAEISGSTLNWLKIFSQATLEGNTYLQVRLDASASTELQEKRLKLLYTIFMNNGVDFKKVDTVFSLTEPNAFIIRTLKIK